MAEKINWSTKDDFDCVIICGGLGTRMFPLTVTNQKTTLPVNEKPLLSYIVDFWRPHCKRFIFISGYQSAEIEDFIKSLDVETELLVESEPAGIAMALLKVESIVKSPFIMALGDCLCHGKFFFPGNMEQGIGYTIATNPLAITQSYSIEIRKGMAVDLKEKPDKLINNFLGMGIYFFSNSVFSHIKKAAPSQRTGKVEITDVIQNMVIKGRSVHAVHFVGEYINVTYPEDLLVADRIVKGMLDEKQEHKGVGLLGEIPHDLAGISGVERIENLLVVRSLPLAMFEQVIRFIRRTMQVGTITVLCQPSVEEKILAIDGVSDACLFDGDEPFGFGPGSFGLIRGLRGKKFDAILLPYNNPNRTGYFNLELLARLVSPRIHGYIPPKNIFMLSWWSILRTRRFPFARTLERLVFYSICLLLLIRRTVFAGSKGGGGR